MLRVHSRKSQVLVREIPGTVLKPSRVSVCVLARDRHDPAILLTHISLISSPLPVLS